MSKIYEALEHARREVRVVEPPKPEAPPPEGQQQPTPLPVISAMVENLEINLEAEMVGLYQAVESLLPGIERKIIQFIGSRAGEGTSTIVRQFARVCAKMNKSILVLDIDRLKPALRFYDARPECDLEAVVRGDAPLEKALCRVEDTSIYVSPLFENSRMSPQMLDAPRTQDLWEELRNRFDFVLIDSPPATVSPDGLSVTRRADGIILVVEAEKTRWPVAMSTKERIVSHGGKILGLVFNKRRYYIPGWIYRRL